MARNGEPMVRLAPVAGKASLAGWGPLWKLGRKIDRPSLQRSTSASPGARRPPVTLLLNTEVALGG